MNENDAVLPITANCLFQKFGGAGVAEKKDSLCVLPLNMVNQKFYTFFCIWLAVLFVLTIGNMTLRLILIISREFREIVFNVIYGTKNLKVNRKYVDSNDETSFHEFFQRTIVKRSSHGDWLLLDRLLDNMNVVVSAQFLKELGEAQEYDDDDDLVADKKQMFY